MLPNSIAQDDSLDHYRHKDGGAFAVAFQTDSRIRGGWIGDTYIISLVDFMAVWGMPKETARRKKIQDPSILWRNEKKRLLKRKPELRQNLSSLKMKGSDGKFYATDVCDLETAIRILFYMDTPASDEFKDLCAKLISHSQMSEWEYRKHYAAIAASGSINPIQEFLEDVGATYFNGKDEGRLD